MIHTLIVDDEDWARSNIKAALSPFQNWQVVAEWEEAGDLSALMREQRLDVVFLDIHMPGKNGLALAREWMTLAHCPLIVFVTAFDEHAVQAFELAAMDYLLKPFSDTRFRQCLQRVEQALHERSYTQIQQAWLSQSHALTSQRQDYLQQLVIRSVGSIRLVAMEQVHWFAASGNYVAVHHSEGVHLHRVTLNYLEQRLDPDVFCRVHRSAIVKVSEVREVQTLADDRYQLLLSNHDVVNISETYKSVLFARLGV